jgi:glutathione S-transferase
MFIPVLWLTPIAIRKQSREIVKKGFAILDPQLERRRYAASNAVTIHNFALFYIER